MALLNTKIDLFKDLSEQELSEISKYFQLKKLSKNEKLFFQSDKTKNFLILLSGEVKLSNNNTNGDEMVIDILGAGNLINQPFEEYFSCDATALKNSQYLSIEQKTFGDLLVKFPKLTLNLTAILCAKNKDLIKRMESLQLLDAEEKLGSFLLKSAFDKNKKSSEFNLKIKKSLIASYLGIKPETLSRTFKKILQSENISLNKNTICLNEKSSLCRFCDEEVLYKCADNKSHFCKNK